MNAGNLFKTVVVLLLIASLCFAAEKPKAAEHPGAAMGKADELTKAELADAVAAYIKKEASANKGFFPITDDKTGQKLNLELEKVHRERLSKVGKDQYFACVDFKTADGKKKYDIDFFMKGTNKNNLTFSEFVIHKENGKERYKWYEEGGVWKKKPVEETKKSQEQPVKPPAEKPAEHPK